ncbi:tRNA (cytidine(34)-2'-O)-methyltransferase [Oceanomicrobium pacificus]|uniref:tRNA (cytidine(34)-2'-O)-methyltransferase n=1 Tax=Oceanomicrobium pacificus TaxID=2692916 RepID=A0A6B0U1H4_9RHOB|nr:tRNA (cytidine(34)-2'-O)-methyltransferase [Oceanomicrobium pacificus]MXU64951.1 hypothetical protein [Oceanomicrobium pacificus]
MRLVAFEPDIAPNLGAMIRLAACFGMPLDVIEPCGFPFSVKALRRAAMDYADLADICRHDSWDDYAGAPHAGRLVLLTTAGADPLWDFTFAPEDRIMVGRETAGVPPPVSGAADARLRIPMVPPARSMNVVTAAAIAVGEAVRQIGHTG